MRLLLFSLTLLCIAIAPAALLAVAVEDASGPEALECPTGCEDVGFVWKEVGLLADEHGEPIGFMRDGSVAPIKLRPSGPLSCSACGAMP